MSFSRRGLAAILGFGLLTISATCRQHAANPRPEQLATKMTVEAALKKHVDNLMSLPGVVGVAQGECAGKPCIKVYVVRKTSDLVKQIPSAIEGYTVVVEETGDIRPLDPS